MSWPKWKWKNCGNEDQKKFMGLCICDHDEEGGKCLVCDAPVGRVWEDKYEHDW